MIARLYYTRIEVAQNFCRLLLNKSHAKSSILRHDR